MPSTFAPVADLRPAAGAARVPSGAPPTATAVAPKEWIAWATDLPALPAAVADLLTLVSDPDVDIDELCARLSVDMALTAKVLRLANSSFYGARGAVTSVDAAVGRVGLRMVKGIVTAVAVSGSLKPPVCLGFDFALFWREAVARATASQVLAFATGVDPSTAFTAGLLLRVGELVLASQAPARFAETLVQRKLTGRDALEIERELLGVDHATIGAKVAAHWRLPPAIVEALGQQEPPLADGQPPTLGQVVMAADRLLGALADGADAAVAGPGPAAAAWAAAGAPGPIWQQTGSDAARQAEAISSALEG